MIGKTNLYSVGKEYKKHIQKLEELLKNECAESTIFDELIALTYIKDNRIIDFSLRFFSNLILYDFRPAFFLVISA